MARRNDHSRDELRELIFKSACDLNREQGIRQFSARKLAAKMGYSPGTVYNFFTNLDELILHVNGHTLDLVYEELFKKLKDIKDKKEAIKVTAETYMNFGLREKNLWQTLFEHNYVKNTGNKLPNWYQEKFRKIFHLIEEKLGKNELEAKTFWACLHGICSLSFSGKLSNVKTKSDKALLEEFYKLYN